MENQVNSKTAYIWVGIVIVVIIVVLGIWYSRSGMNSNNSGATVLPESPASSNQVNTGAQSTSSQQNNFDYKG
jgi:hypothetical protein